MNQAVPVQRGGKTGDTMASVFQHDGRWHAKYKNERGLWATKTCGGADKATAKRQAEAWETQARDIREGRTDPRLKRFRAEALRPLAEQVADFRAMLIAKGNTIDHADDASRHVTRVITAIEAERLPDVTAGKVQTFIAGLKDGGLGLRTCNAILRSVKTFAGWLEADGRIRHNELRHVKGFNDSTDKRLVRRDLADDELGRIIAAARGGPVSFGMAGPDRAMGYMLAAGTGFRRKELASLTKTSFALAGDAPTVTIAAAYSKHRRLDVQPIDPALADALAGWLRGKADTGPVLALPGETAEMLHTDMRRAKWAWWREAAGADERKKRAAKDFLKPVDGEGRIVDFHALRHYYISQVVRSGASVKVCMDLARHSTPTLTLGRYAHTRLADLRGAVPTVPTGDKPKTEPTALRATGTDNAQAVNLTNAESSATRAQHLGRETVRSNAIACEDAGTLRLIGGMEESLENIGENDTLRDDAKDCEDIGRGRIRTCVDISQRIYSPPLLAAQARAPEKGLLYSTSPAFDNALPSPLLVHYPLIPPEESCGHQS